MFAGPNGSGKSVLKSYLPPPLLGVYLNADEMEAEVSRLGFLDCRQYGIDPSADAILAAFARSVFLIRAGFGEQATNRSDAASNPEITPTQTPLLNPPC